MAAPVTESHKLTKTFKDTNYFAVGTYKRDFVEFLTSGALTNFIVTTALGPLERWKIIKQTQMTYDYRPKDKISSITGFFSKVSQQQGVKALWRGNSAHLWMQFWQAAAQIFMFDSIKSTFNEIAFEMQNDPISKFLVERIAAPLCASATSLAITHPIDTARVRISMNYFRNPHQMFFNGILSCWGMIRLENDMKALYRGYLLANFIALLHINIYVTFRDLWNSNKVDLGQYGDVFASKQMMGLLGSILLLHPLDTIKKNLQLSNQDKTERSLRLTNARQVFRQFQSRHGLMSLYQGLTVTLFRQALFCPTFLAISEPINDLVKIF